MKKIMAVVLGITVSFALAACGSNAPEGNQQASAEQAAQEEPTEEKGKIGILAPNMALDFQLQMGAGIKRAAEEKGYGYMEYDYKGDPEQEIAGIETLTASGVEGIYGIFMTPKTDSEKLEEYQDIGIISQAPGMDAADAIIVNDNAEIGNGFVEALDYFMEENNLEDGDIATIWISACENKDSSSYLAMEEIMHVIEKHYEGTPQTIAANYFADDAEEASDITTQILNANPNVKYIFTYNNNYAIAAANELQSAMPDTNGYFIFSSESDEETLRLIESGTSPLRACTSNNVEETGYAAGLELINWIENGEINDVKVTRTMVDKRNIDELYH